MTFSTIFSNIEKYLGLAIVGVHAASTVVGATNVDKKQAVLSTITGVTDAVAAASGNPEIQAASVIVDVVAGVINALATKATVTLASAGNTGPSTGVNSVGTTTTTQV